MAFMPMMPQPDQGASAPAELPASPAGGLDLMSLLGGSPSSSDPSALSNAAASAMQQFDQLEQIVMQLAQMFPGNEQFARQIMDGVNLWRQTIVVNTAPPSYQMPGAAQMM